MRRELVLVLFVATAGCKAAVSPELLRSYQGRTLYTCCNFHYETDAISDANYFVGSTLPLGTPVQVLGAVRNGVTVQAGGTTLTLRQDYGGQQETFQQYLDKVLVGSDPQAGLATMSKSAQQAIGEGRVEPGMTKEQVILSLGYPPTHRTASTAMNEWTYWYNRWISYKVQFDDKGAVSNVVGRPAPTRDQPIEADPPPPRAAPKPAAKGKAKGH